MEVGGGEGTPALSSGVPTASSPEPVPVRSARGRRASAREMGRGERPMTRREEAARFAEAYQDAWGRGGRVGGEDCYSWWAVLSWCGGEGGGARSMATRSGGRMGRSDVRGFRELKI